MAASLRAFVFSYAIGFALAIGAGLAPESASAWGRRGHQIVADVAANLAADSDPKLRFLRDRSYDLAYYSNVPDLVWKKPATYKAEWTNHFMDLEIFARELLGSDKPGAQKRALKGELDPYAMDRAEFDARFAGIKQEAGRAWWRIRELNDRLASVAGQLASLGREAPRDERQALQLEWLIIAGALGHYVGDMSQPLHSSENYDGQLSGQKGIHAFYEDDLVDVLYPGLEAEVERRAKAMRAKAWRADREKTALQIARELTERSSAALPGLLRLDKKVGRDPKKAAAAHRSSLIERMADGAVALAELWRRRGGWTYDGEKFYAFDGAPTFISPGPPGLNPSPESGSGSPSATPAASPSLRK